MRSIIFINGHFTAPERVRQLLRPDDYLIAVNGGTPHVLALNLIPHVVIGDLDSLAPEILARLQQASTRLLRFSPNKDETDLELALRHAAALPSETILLVGALGGRLDQMLANILLLSLPCLHGRDVRIIDGAQTAFLIRDRAEITGAPGDTVSILPLGGDAHGVSNDGLEWPLADATLPFGTTRGISNVLRASTGAISVAHGLLLCIVTQHGP